MASNSSASRARLPSSETVSVAEAGMRTLFRARIACEYSMHGFDNLGQWTRGWEGSEDVDMESPLLEIRLHCECAVGECKAMVEILNRILEDITKIKAGAFAELEVRQENAVLASKAALAEVERLSATAADPVAMGVKEMLVRGQHARVKLEVVKDWIAQLAAQVAQLLHYKTNTPIV